MRALLFVMLLSTGLGAVAQYDAGGQNTHGADVDPGKLDAAAKARIRTEGSVGGLQGGMTGSAQEESSSSGAVNTRPAAKTEEAEKDKRRRPAQRKAP